MTRYLFLFFFMGLLIQPKDLSAQDSFKTIVVFFGANETRPAYQRILEGIRSSFPEDSTLRINLISEYLDIERFSDTMHIRKIVSLYNTRVKKNSIDLVITVAPSAYDLLKTCGLRLLEEVPVINMEISPKSPETYIKGTQAVEIQVAWSPGLTIDHAFELFPKVKHAYIVGGCSASDRMFTSGMTSDVSAFADSHQFTYLTCTRIDSVLEVISQLPDTCLVFLATYVTDLDSTPLSTAIALRLFSTHSSVPVFTMSDNFIDYGGVGGRIISFTEVGRDAGKIAKEMLVSAPIKGFEKISKSYYRYQYNWKELQKWGLLDSNVIPSGSIYFYEDINFFKRYRWQLTGLLMLIILQTLLVVYLIRLVRNQKNVAKQKIQNEQLYRQLLREERVTTMSLMTASLAHELNQPLTAILFNAQAGLRFFQSGKLETQQSQAILTDIEIDVKRASGIINSLRTLMKVETKDKEKMDVKPTIREVLIILHTELEQQQVKLEIIEPEQPLIVLADKVQLQQVLINLILNAMRAMKGMSPENKHIQLKSYASNSLVVVSISDTGPGLPEVLQGKLFDPFVSTESDGLGIGLALCKSIIQRHGGGIRAMTLPTGGAEFSFTLPLSNTR